MNKEKLKTLKDLEYMGGGFDCDNTKDYRDEIKKEAIKLGKEKWGYAKKISDNTKVIRLSDFLDFHNIKEGDLNEK